MHQVWEAVVHVGGQVREVAALVLRTLDGATQQMTRMRTHSQMEVVYGPLTFSFASGVIFARPESD